MWSVNGSILDGHKSGILQTTSHAIYSSLVIAESRLIDVDVVLGRIVDKFSQLGANTVHLGSHCEDIDMAKSLGHRCCFDNDAAIIIIIFFFFT